jgi:hypothetical protein
VGSGSADLARGIVVQLWTPIAGQRYYVYFAGDRRTVAEQPRKNAPEELRSVDQLPRHPADPLWFIFVVREGLRHCTLSVAEPEPAHFTVQVDVLRTMRMGGAVQLAHGRLRRFLPSYRRWLHRMEGAVFVSGDGLVIRTEHLAAPPVFGGSPTASAVDIAYLDTTCSRVPLGGR